MDVVSRNQMDRFGDVRGLLTKREVAEFLRVTPRTVETYQSRGLPFYRLGPRRNRYDIAAVLAWLERQNE